MNKREAEKMDIKNILSHCDHTLLAVDSTWEQIKQICEDAIKYETASICIPASYVKSVKEYYGDKLNICTVIGFPNGYSTTAVKAFEAADAVENGANEIDMVINVGWAKDKKFDLILEEIKAVKKACNGKLLKVIIETCLLSEDEKIELCRVVTQSGADFIKTSTGFSTGGATREDIALFAANIGEDVKMKAAGGIRSFEDAEDYLALGCERLGTSAIVKLVKKEEVKGY